MSFSRKYGAIFPFIFRNLFLFPLFSTINNWITLYTRTIVTRYSRHFRNSYNARVLDVRLIILLLRETKELWNIHLDCIRADWIQCDILKYNALCISYPSLVTARRFAWFAQLSECWKIGFHFHIRFHDQQVLQLIPALTGFVECYSEIYNLIGWTLQRGTCERN